VEEDFKGTTASDLIGKSCMIPRNVARGSNVRVEYFDYFPTISAADAGLSSVVSVTIHGSMLDVCLCLAVAFSSLPTLAGVPLSPEDECERRRDRG
jgi:hypothetical protein